MEQDGSGSPAVSGRLDLLKNCTFFGSYEHTIDAKGRIIIPNAYRYSLGEFFTISITRDGQGIAIYPDAVFNEMLVELMALNPLNPRVGEYRDYLAGMSFRSMQADNQGRVVLPLTLKQEVLGDAKDVRISGAMDHIRIQESGAAKAAMEHFKRNRVSILNEIANLSNNQ